MITRGLVRRLCTLLVLTLAASAFATAADHHDFRTYQNTRFGYSIDYPADLLTPQKEPENLDGRKFVSKDGEVVMLVFGSNNVLDQSVSDVYRDAIGKPSQKITYKSLRPGWFVISGKVADQIGVKRSRATTIKIRKLFYQKTMLDSGVFRTFRIEYPPGRAATYKRLIPRIIRSFKLSAR